MTSTTEGAAGVTKAIDALWPNALRIRCWFHTRQNLQPKVPPPAGPEFTTLVAAMGEAPPVAEAERRGQLIVPRSQRDFPEACRCLLDDAEASLNPLSVPQRHHPSVRTSNLAARAFEEERRRTPVIPPLGDEGRVVKLVFAVLIRVSERWGEQCFSPFAQHQIRSLRRQRHLDEQTVVAAPPTPQPRRSAASAA